MRSKPLSQQPDTIAPIDLVCRLVAAGQCLLPLDPKPTALDIFHVIDKLGDAFDVSPDLRIVAVDTWHRRIGLPVEWRR